MDTSRFGEYDSWIIVNDDIAWKHCDKSFFEYRLSGIPTGIRWFFKIEQLNPGEKRDIILVYDKIKYNATIQRIRMPSGRTRITWDTSLASQFSPYSMDGKPHTLAFKRVPIPKNPAVMNEISSRVKAIIHNRIDARDSILQLSREITE